MNCQTRLVTFQNVKGELYEETVCTVPGTGNGSFSGGFSFGLEDADFILNPLHAIAQNDIVDGVVDSHLLSL